ncbi:MAG: FAD-binding protein [Thermomicrobiales bacterium]|nr:FAD-binding protein [Thermomicrobiales bacterium]
MNSWSNWAGNVVATPATIAAPDSLDALRRAVAAAAEAGQRVRVAGSGHSFMPICATDGMLIDLERLAGVESVDPETGEATIWAGTKIHAIGEPLFRAGQALANQGDIDRQALAGAVSTGTHGTGRGFGSFASMVRSMEIVGPTGDLVTIDTGNEDDLRAASLSVGMLGVVSRLRIATIPAFKLHERSTPMEFDACQEVYPEVESANRHAEFWWIPPLDMCVLKTLTLTDEEPRGGGPDPEFPPGTIERYIKPEKIDWSYIVYPTARNQRFVECEYTLPLADGPVAMRAIREMMRSDFPNVTWAVEYRTVPGETAMLSPTLGQECATISVHHPVDEAWEPFMRASDALLRSLGGRSHWGKMHWLGREEVDALYPEAEAFRAIRRRYDPEGFSLNDHLEPLFS